MHLLKLLCLSSLMLPAVSLTAQQDPLSVESKIERVTVYPGFALIERVALVPAQVVGSDFSVLISPLPMSSQPTSFQTQVVGQALVVQGLEMRSRMSTAANHVKADKLSIELASLKQKLTVQTSKAAGIDLQIEALLNMSDYEIEETAATWGVPEGTSERLEFLREQMTGFNAESQRNSEAIVDIEKQIKDINMQIHGARKASGSKVREAQINCFAQSSAPTQIRLTYLVSGAHWQPSYDLRISTDLTGVSVKSMGQVHQRTGEDWKDISLVLSTSMPQIGLDPPQVPNLVVSVPRPLAQARNSKMPTDAAMIGVGGGAGISGTYKGPGDTLSPSAPAPVAQAIDFGITTQFVMPGKVEVAMNGEAHRFAIRTVPLEVKPERYIVPSQSDNAYLRAEVKHTGDSVLLAGTAKIFLGPDYLGESSFPLMRQNDTTNLNLGIDPNLEVVYETLEDYRDDPGAFSLSSTSNITRRYRASLHLAASAHGSINVVVEESLPISSSNSVEVEAGSISPEAVDTEEARLARKEAGIYTWRFVLKPGESREVLWGYALSFDEEASPVIETR